ncbi:MAG: phosphopantetheine-binding protein [Pseudomonadota bacterium]
MLDHTPLSLKENLKKLIVKELRIKHVSLEELDDDELLFSDRLGLDSIDAVEVVYLVEKHFGIMIRDMKEGRPALQSINTLAAFIESRSN